jgi:mannose-6-phosphate isomerase-like protein (cupin superfamily)
MRKEKPFVVHLEKTNKYQSLLQGSPQTRGMRAGRMLLLAGQDCGQHSTNDNEELLVFLVGEGEVIIEKSILQVGAGRISYIPSETIHNVRNTGDEPLIYIYCVAPVNQKKSGL